MPEAETAEADLALVGEAARAAGELAMRFFRRDPQSWMKLGNSPVSEADIAVDAFLRDRLGAARPDYGWLSEETTDNAERLAARRTFVVDPIDGTRAFLAGDVIWCVSVAIVENGRPLVGVLDCPAARQVYIAHAGGGARLNGSPIAVREDGPPYLVGGPKALIRSVPETLRDACSTVAYVPSLAYRVAMVASGVIHAAFMKENSHDWDLAACDLILREAGGEIRNARGDNPIYATARPTHGVLVAGSGGLLEKIAAAIRPAAGEVT